MKAARDRLKSALTVKTQKSIDAEKGGQPRRRIRQCTEADVMKTYKLGTQVMESTNTGMDVVFATRIKDNVQVVIKTRKRSNSFKSASEERDWRATTEYQLNMPKTETLCEFFEVLETREYYYVIMEKVGGQDLFEQMATDRLNHLDSREVVRQILDGLRAMHTDGRIHKDLKIENVMIDRMETPTATPTATPVFDESSPCSPVIAKLIDFDTCQDWEPTSPKAKDVLGTDGYIAPEAYGGDYSPASDLYAVGVIMYKMLTGKFPLRPDIFDDQPGENWVGSPAMQRIQSKLRTEPINFTVPPFDKCPEAADLCGLLTAYDPDCRPTAEDALRHDWFLIQPDKLQ